MQHYINSNDSFLPLFRKRHEGVYYIELYLTVEQRFTSQRYREVQSCRTRGLSPLFSFIHPDQYNQNLFP